MGSVDAPINHINKTNKGMSVSINQKITIRSVYSMPNGNDDQYSNHAGDDANAGPHFSQCFRRFAYRAAQMDMSTAYA
jgi:hypothetical protein